MITIHRLTSLDAADLKRVASGYTSDGKYGVLVTDTERHTVLDLRYVPLDRPYVKAFDHFDDETLRRYAHVLKANYSFGAFADNLLVGLVLGEPHLWNHSLWVHEFHVAATHRRLGIGRRLMDAVADEAKSVGLRVIVCETQNTNAPAIQAYRQLGFRVEGVDISYYSNHDYPDGEIAMFMKRRLF